MSWPLLNVVIIQIPTFLQLLPDEYQLLLVWWDFLLILNLHLDIVNNIKTLNILYDGLFSQSLHKYLHTTEKMQYQMESRLFVDVVIDTSPFILQFLANKDLSLLV